MTVPCTLQDENTRYVCIGPVNKAINMLCCWLEDPDSEAFKRSAPYCSSNNMCHSLICSPASRPLTPCYATCLFSQHLLCDIIWHVQSELLQMTQQHIPDMTYVMPYMTPDCTLHLLSCLTLVRILRVAALAAVSKVHSYGT